MKYTLPVIISQDEDGIYVGEVPRFKGCHTYGNTLEELYKNLEEVITIFLEREEEQKSSLFSFAFS